MRLSSKAKGSLQLNVVGEVVERFVGRGVEDLAQFKELHQLGNPLQ